MWSGTAWTGDTGWQAMTAKSGFTSSGARARVKDDILYIDGSFIKTSSNIAAGDVAGSFPPTIADMIQRTIRLNGWTGSGAGLIVSAVTSGDLVCGGAAASQTLYLGGGGPLD